MKYNLSVTSSDHLHIFILFGNTFDSYSNALTSYSSIFTTQCTTIIFLIPIRLMKGIFGSYFYLYTFCVESQLFFIEIT